MYGTSTTMAVEGYKKQVQGGYMDLYTRITTNNDAMARFEVVTRCKTCEKCRSHIKWARRPEF